MNGSGFQIIQKLLLILEILLYGGCFSIFISKLYYKKAQCLRKIAVISVLYIIGSVWILAWNLPSSIVLLGIFLLMTMESAIRKKGSKELLLFLFVTWYCEQYLCYFIVNSLYTRIIDYAAKDVLVLHDTYVKLLFVYGIGVLLRVLLISIMSFWLSKRISANQEYMNGKAMMHLLLMPIAGGLFGMVISKVLRISLDNTYFDIYERYPMFLWIIPIVSIIYYFCILFSISIYSSMAALQEERKKNFVKEQQIQALKNRMEETEKFYDTTRRMRHEMRNHALTIKGLLDRGEHREINAYISQMEQGMGQFDFSIKTGNSVTDVIINDTKKKAEKEQIEFQTEFLFHQKTIGIEAFDMGIVVNNLLGNALEACQKQPHGAKKIQICGKQKKNFFILEVRNSFTGSMEWDEKTGLPVSTKEGVGDMHGIGLKNVSIAAEKYLGSMDIKMDKGMFCVTVLMQGKG